MDLPEGVNKIKINKMKYLKTQEQFNIKIPEIKKEDRQNFLLIFNSLYEKHLTINERKMIEDGYGLINESWFSDLVNKSKRGVLKIASDAGRMLADLAEKAKDILDFAKQLSSKIGDYVKGQFTTLKEKIKNYAMSDNQFAKILLEFLEKKKKIKLKTYISDSSSLLQYIVSGQMINDLVTRLSEVFSKVLNLGKNEGLYYIEQDFLFEQNEEDGENKKSFLQRLGEKIMTFPPFSWIPRMDEIMKKGISYLGKMIDKFFSWLTTGKEGMSKFFKSIDFLFRILELYVQYKVIGNINKYKEMLKNATGLEELTNQLKDKSLSEVWKTCGINSDEIVNNVKNAIKKIPYVGDILSILDSLVISIGIYLSVEPTLKNLTT